MARLWKKLVIFALAAFVVTVYIVVSIWNYLTVPVNVGIHRNDHQPPFPGNTADNIWWFVQISDIHLNEMESSSRYHHLQHFCMKYIDIIQPKLVLVTDLTDSMYKGHVGQRKIDWQKYRQILEDTGVVNKTVWLDVRGNHDVYDVISADSNQHFYRNFSHRGRQGESHFLYQVKSSFGIYSFIYINAVRLPASKIPFNFFGYLNKDDVTVLQEMKSQTKDSNAVIYYGHFPSSFIVSDDPGLSIIMSDGIAFLSGHLHDVYGYVKDLKCLQRSGTLELELADWRESRKYRIIAFDHDLLSFVDVSYYDEFPVILITNPKDAHFMAHKHEPLGRINKSTHIRFLVFSPHKIQFARVEIDGVLIGNAEHVNGPLYVMKWNTSLYQNGIHTITIMTMDTAGRITKVNQLFSLDGHRPLQNIISSFLLMTDIGFLLKMCFIIGITLTLVPLILLRKYTTPSLSNFLWIPLDKFPLLRGLFLLVHIDWLYYLIIVLACWNFMGPWFIGEIVEGHIGFTCLYGFYINSGLYSDPIQYRESTYSMLYSLVPFIFHTALHLELIFPARRSVLICGNHLISWLAWGIKFAITHILFLYATEWLLNYSKAIILQKFGLMAFILSPKYLWVVVTMIIVYVILLIQYAITKLSLLKKIDLHIRQFIKVL